VAGSSKASSKASSSSLSVSLQNRPPSSNLHTRRNSPETRRLVVAAAQLRRRRAEVLVGPLVLVHLTERLLVIGRVEAAQIRKLDPLRRPHPVQEVHACDSAERFLLRTLGRLSLRRLAYHFGGAHLALHAVVVDAEELVVVDAVPVEGVRAEAQLGVAVLALEAAVVEEAALGREPLHQVDPLAAEVAEFGGVLRG
jgi:hypothetical protein